MVAVVGSSGAEKSRENVVIVMELALMSDIKNLAQGNCGRVENLLAENQKEHELWMY